MGGGVVEYTTDEDRRGEPSICQPSPQLPRLFAGLLPSVNHLLCMTVPTDEAMTMSLGVVCQKTGSRIEHARVSAHELAARRRLLFLHTPGLYVGIYAPAADYRAATAGTAFLGSDSIADTAEDCIAFGHCAS